MCDGSGVAMMTSRNSSTVSSASTTTINQHQHQHQRQFPTDCGATCLITVALCCFAKCDAKALINKITFHPPKPAMYELKTTNRGRTYPQMVLANHPRLKHHAASRNLKHEVREAQAALASFTAHTVLKKKRKKKKRNDRNGGDDDEDDDEEEVYLRAFYRPAPRDAKRARVIVHSHGNAMDCGGIMEMLAEIGNFLDVSIVSYDYTGYGKSGNPEAKPTVEETLTDAEAVLDWVTKTSLMELGFVTGNARDFYKYEDVVLWGQSLGTGPATKLASEKKVGGLILECPLASGTRVLVGEAKEKISCVSPVLCFKSCEIFDNQSLASGVKCPALVMHGLNDFEIHHTHGKMLYEKLCSRGLNNKNHCKVDELELEDINDSKSRDLLTLAYWAKTAGHDDVFYDNPGECMRQVQKFLRALPTTQRIENATMSNRVDEKGFSADDLAMPETRAENKNKKPYNNKFNKVDHTLFYETPPRKQTMQRTWDKY